MRSSRFIKADALYCAVDRPIDKHPQGSDGDLFELNTLIKDKTSSE